MQTPNAGLPRVPRTARDYLSDAFVLQTVGMCEVHIFRIGFSPPRRHKTHPAVSFRMKFLIHIVRRHRFNFNIPKLQFISRLNYLHVNIVYFGYL